MNLWAFIKKKPHIVNLHFCGLKCSKIISGPTSRWKKQWDNSVGGNKTLVLSCYVGAGLLINLSCNNHLIGFLWKVAILGFEIRAYKVDLWMQKDMLDYVAQSFSFSLLIVIHSIESDLSAPSTCCQGCLFLTEFICFSKCPVACLSAFFTPWQSCCDTGCPWIFYLARMSGSANLWGE